MKYGEGTNKGMLKVRRKCSTATVKVRLHSTELVQSRKACFNRSYNVPYVMFGNFFLAPTVQFLQRDILGSHLLSGKRYIFRESRSGIYIHRTHACTML